MIDSHVVPDLDGWGVMPVLVWMGGMEIQSYPFFVLLGILVGALVYFYEAHRQKSANERTFYLVIAALVGGAIGAKLPILIFHFREILSLFPDVGAMLSGRTVVGGLIGGTVAVMVTKRLIGMRDKKGNLFAPAIALGIAVGRIGRFLRGCCYGIATALPWGVDFGDGIRRHPTELYESIFMLGMFVYLQWARGRNPKPGALFRRLMVSYFSFRFAIEFIRTEPIIFGGLTGYQIASVVVLVYYACTSPFVIKLFKRTITPEAEAGIGA